MVVAQLVIVPAVQVRWNDLSGQISISATKTDASTVLLDEGAGSTSENTEEAPSKRAVKTARNRFASEEDQDES